MDQVINMNSKSITNNTVNRKGTKRNREANIVTTEQRYRKRLFCFANFGRFRDVSGYPYVG